jgi:hypothetical protein
MQYRVGAPFHLDRNQADYLMYPIQKSHTKHPPLTRVGLPSH